MDKIFSIVTLVFLLVALLGVFMHSVKKWTQGEITGSVVDWFVMNPKATVGVLLVAGSGVVSGVIANELTDFHAGVQFGAAFLLGFSADTFNNQGKK
jgi:hypothetical protein